MCVGDNSQRISLASETRCNGNLQSAYISRLNLYKEIEIQLEFFVRKENSIEMT